MICKTIRYSAERLADSKSIVKVTERLDFRTLLQRASAGILDLRQFQLPRSSDVSGSSVDDPANCQALDDLLNRPKTVMDNCFGASVEEAEAELRRHESVLSRCRQQSEEAKYSDNDDRINAEGRDKGQNSLEKQDPVNPS